MCHFIITSIVFEIWLKCAAECSDSIYGKLKHTIWGLRCVFGYISGSI